MIKSNWGMRFKRGWVILLMVLIIYTLVIGTFYIESKLFLFSLSIITMILFLIILLYINLTIGREEYLEFVMKPNKLINLIDSTLEEKNIKYEKKCNGQEVRDRFRRLMIEIYNLPKYNLDIRIQKSGKVLFLILSEENDQNQKVRKFLKSKLRKEIVKS
jgi:hypothetical protein